MINILINGANGKMGRKVLETARLTDGVKAVCGVDLKEDFSDSSYPIYSSLDSVKENVDVVVDFSSPKSLDGILKYCQNKNIPAVLCSTGYTEVEVEKVKRASNFIPVFRSGNMSLGVNVLIDLVKKATSALGNFDVEIVEKHHNQKVDAPSGTALMLADAVKSVDDKKFYTYGRQGIVGKRDKNEIGIHAIRGGNIVGVHEVMFAGNYETVTITHQATDRSVFAEGAIKACQFIVNKGVGLYDMSDVING